VKIKEAIEILIEILEELPDNVNNALDNEQQDALKLGIEALKRIKDLQFLPGRKWSFRLPGETEE